jgi:hypothetical protein
LIAKSVFWAILFLRGKYSLIEKLCVLASIECIVLKVLGSFSFWLLDDGFKFLLFIYSLVIIVIFGAQYRISSVNPQPVLGGGVS